MSLFKNFSDNARIWLYQTNRPIEGSEQENIKTEITRFVNKWAAHGNKLLADGALINPYFIVFVVEDEKTLPSGCSIDSSVKFLKDIGQRYNIDFFNRLNVYVRENNEIKKYVFSKLENLPNDTLVYDPLITKLGDLRNHWPAKLMESNFRK